LANDPTAPSILGCFLLTLFFQVIHVPWAFSADRLLEMDPWSIRPHFLVIPTQAPFFFTEGFERGNFKTLPRILSLDTGSLPMDFFRPLWLFKFPRPLESPLPFPFRRLLEQTPPPPPRPRYRTATIETKACPFTPLPSFL